MRYKSVIIPTPLKTPRVFPLNRETSDTDAMKRRFRENVARSMEISGFWMGDWRRLHGLPLADSSDAIPDPADLER